MSLRHLFSTKWAQNELRLSYIGPVLNDAGTIESSPDCVILDMRTHPSKLLRCEFKHIPSGKDDFSHNGLFDIAILWSLPTGVLKQRLESELLQQNGCSEIIVLETMKAFRDLPAYTIDALKSLGTNDIVKKLALRRECASVFALCIAARLYPEKFQMDRMVELLSSKFPSVKRMQPRGRANVVSAFIQTKPPLLTWRQGKFYCWTSEMNSRSASDELTQLIKSHFGDAPPTDDDLLFVSS